MRLGRVQPALYEKVLSCLYTNQVGRARYDQEKQ